MTRAAPNQAIPIDEVTGGMAENGAGTTLRQRSFRFLGPWEPTGPPRLRRRQVSPREEGEQLRLKAKNTFVRHRAYSL